VIALKQAKAKLNGIMELKCAEKRKVGKHEKEYGIL